MQISYALHEVQAQRRRRTIRKRASWLVMPRPSNEAATAAVAFFNDPAARLLARCGLTREQVSKMGGSK